MTVLINKLCVWIALGFGLGRSPIAPGTVGTLLGIPLAWGISRLPGLFWQVPAALLLALVCIPITTVAEKALGGEKDDGRIVADEYLTFPICLLGLPWTESGQAWLLPAAFALNRAFDIIKPFPAYRLQALKGGVGITIDDLIASCYALGTLWVLHLWIRPLFTT